MSFKADSRVRNFFGTSTHDAMFELENVKKEISSIVLGKDVSNKNKMKVTVKRKVKDEDSSPNGECKLQMVKTLRKVYTNKKKK